MGYHDRERPLVGLTAADFSVTTAYSSFRTTISPCTSIVPPSLLQASFPSLPRHAYTHSTEPPASTLHSLYRVETCGLNSSSLPC